MAATARRGGAQARAGRRLRGRGNGGVWRARWPPRRGTRRLPGLTGVSPASPRTSPADSAPAQSPSAPRTSPPRSRTATATTTARWYHRLPLPAAAASPGPRRTGRHLWVWSRDTRCPAGRDRGAEVGALEAEEALDETVGEERVEDLLRQWKPARRASSRTSTRELAARVSSSTCGEGRKRVKEGKKEEKGRVFVGKMRFFWQPT